MPTELGAIGVRDLLQEAKDLSEEEAEFDEKCQDLRTRGFNYMIPLGKTLTLREETIDQQADEDASEAGMHQEDGSLDAENDDTVPGNTTGEQDGDEQDLDADLEDMENQPEFEDDEEEEEEEEDGDGNAELSLDEPDAMSE